MYTTLNEMKNSRRYKDMKIVVDPEFEALIPPLSDDEFNRLEANIIDDGEVLDAIKTWQGVIVDGHNRWRIIQKHPEISFKTYEMIFFTRDDAKKWIIDNQLGRRNLSTADRIMLAQMSTEITAKKAKENQRLATGGDRKSEEAKNHGLSKMTDLDSGEETKRVVPISTRKEIAKLAEVSEGTVAQFEQVQKKAPELIEPIRKGEMTIGGAYRAVKESGMQSKKKTESKYDVTVRLSKKQHEVLNFFAKEMHFQSEEEAVQFMVDYFRRIVDSSELRKYGFDEGETLQDFIPEASTEAVLSNFGYCEKTDELIEKIYWKNYDFTDWFWGHVVYSPQLRSNEKQKVKIAKALKESIDTVEDRLNNIISLL